MQQKSRQSFQTNYKCTIYKCMKNRNLRKTNLFIGICAISQKIEYSVNKFIIYSTISFYCALLTTQFIYFVSFCVSNARNTLKAGKCLALAKPEEKAETMKEQLKTKFQSKMLHSMVGSSCLLMLKLYLPECFI